jgi:hypothetical protein
MKRDRLKTAGLDLGELNFDPKADMTAKEWVDNVVRDNALGLLTAHSHEQDIDEAAITASFNEITAAGYHPLKIAVSVLEDARSMNSESHLDLTKIWIEKALTAGAKFSEVQELAKRELRGFKRRDVVFTAMNEWGAAHPGA